MVVKAMVLDCKGVINTVIVREVDVQMATVYMFPFKEIKETLIGLLF